jgi:hypothetical protein
MELVIRDVRPGDGDGCARAWLDAPRGTRTGSSSGSFPVPGSW